MSFASFEFLMFFIITLAGTAILQKVGNHKLIHCFLLIASYFFYGYWDWRFCFLLLFVTVTAFLTAKHTENKVLFSVGIIVPLVVLGIFKYFNFFVSSLSVLAGGNIGTLNIILPVGISFYTFQALSYVIDVKRKKIEAEKDFVSLALYISFFPQLVAGPIVKAADFLPQLKENRRITLKGIECGLQLMLFGLFKKIVFADHMSVFVDDVFRVPSAFKWTTIILAVVSYSLQIYFDFSGYSDIAIGCAKCFGYDFLPNFNIPYLSSNITEFWRRWHISLSTWLKEYLYIPLGGNRKGTLRQYINLFITMLLGGLWHGANWTFVCWGGINGLWLCLDKLRIRHSKTKENPKGFKFAIGVLTTYILCTFLWIIFRADNFDTALAVIKGIFTLQQGITQHFFWSYASIIVMIISSLCAIIKSKKENLPAVTGFYPLVKLTKFSGLVLFFTAWGLLFALAFTGEAPFVYFQF